MKAKDMKPMIMMFLVIMVGASFINVIANSNAPTTNIQTMINDSIVISSARLVGGQINQSTQFSLDYATSVTGKNYFQNFVLRNSTGATIGASNYSFNSTTGILNLTNTTFWVSGGGSVNNQTYSDYDYKASGYVEDAGTRSIFGLILFFMALGVMLCVIGYMNWDDLKDWFG